MSLNTEQFTAANKATVDSLLAVANTALASAERIAALNLDTAPHRARRHRFRRPVRDRRQGPASCAGRPDLAGPAGC
jgi:hypothetical protein